MTIRGGGNPNNAMAFVPSVEWARRPELRRRCAWLHHGCDPNGSTEYKVVPRMIRPDRELPSGCRRAEASKAVEKIGSDGFNS
jgi:hypothetical protein